MEEEKRCINHPENLAEYYCAEDQVWLCDECVSCRHPGVYCKYRTKCIVCEEMKNGD
ncbi:MAG: hypothetical protein M1269_04325 [Chloroflexi bacterium]|nr:hypothetical protein [Chloroflexota bacterium]